ncbi:hypothetical protein ACLKA7_010347 [Drosophila subpalustris]
MSRALGNQKLSKAAAGNKLASGSNCEELSQVNATSTSEDAALRMWGGRSLSSSSSNDSDNDNNNENNDNNENNEDNDNNEDSDNSNDSSSSGSGSSSGSSSGSGSGSDSGSGSGSDSSSDNSDDDSAKSETEDVAAFRVDEYFRDRFKDKLTAEFKAELPTIETDLANSQPTLIRIPNFMPVELDAYEDHAYKNAMSQDDLKDNESREAFITKLKTTVRWRESQDKATGALYKESNARFVRWSDGSQTFHVGGEAFDVIRHPVPVGQNQLYVCLGNYYQRQCSIKEKITLRPKLESNFGLSHVQGLRKRAFYKPMSNCVKMLTDLTTNPVLDRERKVKEEWAQTRKEKCQQRREQQNQRKPSVKPMRHCTADDFEGDAPMQQAFNANLDNPSGSQSNGNSGIRTHRNADIELTKEGSDFEDSDNDFLNLSEDS